MVSPKEIIEALRIPPNTHFFELMRIELINRIEAEGIAPPDGMVLVPIEDCDSCGNTGKLSMGYMSGYCNCHCRRNPVSRFNQNTEATPFRCGINGDSGWIDGAWTPPCKVFCGRAECALESTAAPKGVSDEQ